MHRDLKLENILLDKNFNVKLVDFGFSTESHVKLQDNCDHMLKSYTGCCPYAAPEILAYDKEGFCNYNGEQTDVFALGVIIFWLLTGKPPFYIADP